MIFYPLYAKHNLFSKNVQIFPLASLNKNFSSCHFAQSLTNLLILICRHFLGYWYILRPRRVVGGLVSQINRIFKFFINIGKEGGLDFNIYE